MKERITITIEQPLIADIDKTVDGINVKNRSHAIEVLLRKAVGGSIPDTAVILCGGQGTRFRPITYEIPKVMLPIQGKPILEHIIDLFKRFGVHQVYLSVGYLREKIKDHFGDGKRFGLKIDYLEEDEALGTAGPLRMLAGRVNRPFFVANGDELKDVDLDDMFKTHIDNRGRITIALTTVEDPSQYGVADLSGSKIIRFIEKPPKEEAPSNLISSGLYILDQSIIDVIPKEGFAMLEKDVFPKIAQEGRLIGYPFSGQWFDTGNIERYERALKNWKGIQVRK